MDNTAITVIFRPPTAEEMIGRGLNPEAVRQILHASWWGDMVTDIIETPDYCEADDGVHDVLNYARDVVSDYIRKRFRLV
jgi:hypothetical protein